MKNVVIANRAKPTANDFKASPTLSNAFAPFLIGLLILPSKNIAPPIKTKLASKKGIATRPTIANNPAKAKFLANFNIEELIKSRTSAPFFIVLASLPNFENVGIIIPRATSKSFAPIRPIGNSKAARAKFLAKVPIELDII